MIHEIEAPGFITSREAPEFITSPMGRGRIASAIRVRGYGLTIDRNPSPQPSPYGRGSAIPAVAALKPTIQPVRIKL
jgi:hypothetical protein